jgi:sporulation protein YlmC with PRC-barrel domain
MKENQMKQKLSLLAGGLIALGLSVLPAHAQGTSTPMPAQANFGPKVKWDDITEVKVTNLQGAPLGRIQDLPLDLSNGRVVEVLVVYDQHLRLGGKTVAVPPGALIADDKNKVYQINISEEAFQSAPKFDLSTWANSTQTDKVADAYRYFGQDPYFLVTGEPSRVAADGQPIVSLGYVERMSKLLNMPVDNVKGGNLGKLQSLVLDVPNGRILNAFINAGGFGTPLNYSTVIPPTLLSFNAKRDGLVLDVNKVAYDKEPSVIFQDGVSGQSISFTEQAATGPHTHAPLVQGTSFHDISTTSEIDKSMQTNNLDTWGVEVATLAGRVTLRGTVNNQGTKDSIGAIAVGLVMLDNVDNQIQVMAPAVMITPTQASL